MLDNFSGNSQREEVTPFYHWNIFNVSTYTNIGWVLFYSFIFFYADYREYMYIVYKYKPSTRKIETWRVIYYIIPHTDNAWFKASVCGCNEFIKNYIFAFGTRIGKVEVGGKGGLDTKKKKKISVSISYMTGNVKKWFFKSSEKNGGNTM